MLYSAFHETWPLHCCLSDYFPSSETIEKTLMSLYIVSSRHFNHLHLHGQFFIPLIFVNFLLSLPFCYCLGLQDHFLSSLSISTNASLHSIPLWGRQGLPQVADSPLILLNTSTLELPPPPPPFHFCGERVFSYWALLKEHLILLGVFGRGIAACGIPSALC